MAWKWYDSKVIRIEELTKTVRSFFLEIKDVDNFEFEAGQFVTLDLPISEKRLKRWRSYSIANAPDGSNVIELCVVLLEGGLGSTYLFEEVKIGTELRFKGPSGAFYLPQNIEKDIVMVCTGTGIAPFRSMLTDIINTGKSHKNLQLIYGSRYQEDILYRKELEELSKKHDFIKYDIALSRDENWNGYKGYVHQIYMGNNKEVDGETKYYLCGWTAMIDEAVANLLIKKKVDKKDIIYELYG